MPFIHAEWLEMFGEEWAVVPTLNDDINQNKMNVNQYVSYLYQNVAGGN